MKRSSKKLMYILSIRLPTELVMRIEHYAKRVEHQVPGAMINRSDAIRLLLEDALIRSEQRALR